MIGRQRWISATRTTQRSNHSTSTSPLTSRRIANLRSTRCQTSSSTSILCWEFPAIPGNSRQHSLCYNLAETSGRQQEFFSRLPGSASHQRPCQPDVCSGSKTCYDIDSEDRLALLLYGYFARNHLHPWDSASAWLLRRASSRHFLSITGTFYTFRLHIGVYFHTSLRQTAHYTRRKTHNAHAHSPF